MTARVDAVLAFAGRLLIAALFWWSGIAGILLGWSEVVAFIAARRIPMPALAAGGAGAVELLVPCLLFLRRSEAPAALVLAGYCVATALLFHDYWGLDGGARDAQMMHFLKNFALAGALLVIATRRVPAH